MNRLDIFCFISVARTGSFSIAARELMISQQAVSRHIRSLEEELGFPLFLRGAQSVELSRAGRQMLDYFTQAKRMEEELASQLHRQTPDGLLRIGCSQWLGWPERFSDILAGFQQAQPQTHLALYDLDAGEMAEALERQELDFLLTTRYAAGYLPVAWSALPLWEQPISLIRRRWADEDDAPLSLCPHFAAYAGEPDSQIVRARVQRECAQLGLYPRHIEVCSNMGSVCLNVLLQRGAAFGVQIPAFSGSADFLVEPSGLTATVVLCSPYQAEDPAARRFRQFLTSQMEGIT